MKKSAILFVVALFTVLFAARPEIGRAMSEFITDDGRFTYITDNYLGECTIVKYHGTDANVKVPGKIDSCRVTAIGENAFSGNNAVKAVVLPASVRKIGTYAFYKCSELESVNGLEKVKEVGNYSFSQTKINKVDLSAAEGFLGEGAFSGCVSLKSVVLGEKVRDIGAYAFSGCSSLSKINTSKVVNFGMGSFAKCTSLKKASFSNAARLGDSAFEGSGLTSVKLPKSVTTLDPGCFSYCMSLKKVVLNLGKEVSYGLRNLRNDCTCWTFAGCKALKTVKLGKNVGELGYKMFADTAIEEITIPAATAGIDDTTFADCKNLKDIYFLGSKYTELGVDTGSKVVVHGKKNSDVQKLAKEYKVKFVAA